MTVQIDLSFTLDGRGWYERYYFAFGGFPIAETLDLLADARASLMAFPATLTTGRAVLLADPRHPVQRDYGRVGDFSILPFVIPFRKDEVSATLPDLVVQVGWETEAGAKRVLSLGGTPHGGIAEGKRSLPIAISPRLCEAVDAFRDTLMLPPLQLQIREQIPASEAPTADVAGIDAAPSGLYRVTTRQDFPAVLGGHVRINGSRGNNLTRLRGLRRISQIDGNRTFTVDRGPLPEKGPIHYTAGATVTLCGYRFSQARWRPMGDTRETRILLPTFPFLPPIEVTRVQPYVYPLVARQRGKGDPKRRGRARNRA